MRVITKERLLRLILDLEKRSENIEEINVKFLVKQSIDTLKQLADDCQEIDQLIKNKDNKTTLEKFRENESECQELMDETPIERLRFFISLMCDTKQDSQAWFDIEFLFDECTNNDQLTVTKLRPISEAPRDHTRILGLINNEFVKISCYDKYWSDGDDDYIDDSEVLGWLPMPIFKPEQI